MELADRCDVVREILQEISDQYYLIEWMSMGDSPDDGPLTEQSPAVFFIWRMLAGMQILNMDKLLDNKGKFSIQKLINLAKMNNKKIDLGSIEGMLKMVSDDYDGFKMSFVRDKFIAHLDVVDEVRICIHRYCIVRNGLVGVYNELVKVLGQVEFEYKDLIVEDFKRLFRKVDQS